MEIDALLEKYRALPSTSADDNKHKTFRERLIYNTVAIEGNTMNLQEVRSVLSTNTQIIGHSEKEHLEVKGMDSALKIIDEKKKIGAYSIEKLTLQVCDFKIGLK